MDENTKDNKQLKDEQELAKVLAGINGDQPADAAAPAPEPAPVPGEEPDPEELLKSFNDMGMMADQPSVDVSAAAPAFDAPAAPVSGDLEGIKQSAINDLRPLVDKLDLPEDEKFSTYLLLIRSTNDSTLIAPAYEVAKTIADDTKRAQALLDIVKEIDFFNNPPVAQ